MRLRNKYILLKPDFEVKERADKMGIELPDYAQNVLPDRGEVIAVGPDITEVKVGIRVIIDRFRVDNFKDRAGTFEENLFVSEDLILAII